MSNIYIQEPPTNGKVLLKTTCGEIDIELWPKETPKACRNFIQLCMEGYYDGTVFHRIIPGFMAQGGDPTGTGEGGESVYGHPFKDEFHSRLRFVRRGLIAMANSGPHDNGSQFFITLGPCEHLNNKHTILGKVTGNTVFNLLKLGDVEIGADDKPLYPPKIKSTEILANPFDDIEPRQLKKPKQEKEERKSKSKSKATKNFSLLSFGEEAEEDEEEVSVASQAMKNKSKSMHDLVDDPKLSSVPAVAQEQETPKSASDRLQPPDSEEEEKKDEDVPSSKQMKERIRSKLVKDKMEKEEPEKKVELPPEEKLLSKKEELQKESEKLKQELREGRKRKKEAEDSKMKVAESDEEKETGENRLENDELAEFHAQKKKFKALKKTQVKGASREEQTLALLAKFQSKLHSAIETKKPEPELKEEGEKEEEDEVEEEMGDGWMAGTLQFESQDSKVKDANVKDADTFTIFDPRNPMNKRRREDSKKKTKERR